MGSELTAKELLAAVAAARERDGWVPAESEDELVWDRATGALYSVLTRRRDGSPAEVLEWNQRFWGDPYDPERPEATDGREWFDVQTAWINDRNGVRVRPANAGQLSMEVA